MNRIYSTLSAAVIAALLLVPAGVRAQKEDKDKEKKDKIEKKETETIVITKKGDNNEKVTVVIDGDKITINGKPVEEYKDGDITVNRHQGFGNLRAFAQPKGNFNYFEGKDGFMMNHDENTAMLGVVTEKEEEGVKVTDVTEGSAAAKAGLKENDIITRVDDKKIETPDDLTKAIRAHKPGEKVSLTYLRDKKEQKATAELTKWKGFSIGQMDMSSPNMNWDVISPKVKGDVKINTPGQYRSLIANAADRPKLGLSIQDTEDGKGVKVIDVDKEGNAEKSGVKKDDVIISVNDKAVNSAEEVARAVRESREKGSIMLKLNRGGKTQNIEVKLPKKLKTADL